MDFFLNTVNWCAFLQVPGLVNVDFADVKAVMKDSGTAMLGVGVSTDIAQFFFKTLAGR